MKKVKVVIENISKEDCEAIGGKWDSRTGACEIDSSLKSLTYAREVFTIRIKWRRED